MSAKQKVQDFIKRECERRNIVTEIAPDAELFKSRIFDSLFIVDLILFLETTIPMSKENKELMKIENIDTIEKILRFSEPES